MRRGGCPGGGQMVVVEVVAETLVAPGPPVEVLQAELFGDRDHSRIDLAQQSVDHVEAEVDADLFLPGLPDSAMPEPRGLLRRVVLLEPRLANDEDAGRVQHCPPQRAPVMLLEVLQHGARIRHARANLRRLRAHFPARDEPSADVPLHLHGWNNRCRKRCATSASAQVRGCQPNSCPGCWANSWDSGTTNGARAGGAPSSSQ